MTVTTDKPHAALVFPEGDPEYFEVHLVNPTDQVYERVTILTGAFFSYEEYLVETAKVTSEKGELGATSSILLDRSDIGELDMMVWFHLDLLGIGRTTPELYSFHLPKFAGKGTLLPVLNRNGTRIELEPRKDSIAIPELVKTLDMAGKTTKFES